MSSIPAATVLLNWFRAPGMRAFWWASGGNIILHLRLVAGSKLPNGIISGFHVRLGSRSGPCYCLFTRVLLRGIVPESNYLPRREHYCANQSCAPRAIVGYLNNLIFLKQARAQSTRTKFELSRPQTEIGGVEPFLATIGRHILFDS